MTVFTFVVFIRRTGEILRVRRLLLKPGVKEAGIYAGFYSISRVVDT
jgi:hypothetical protein